MRYKKLNAYRFYLKKEDCGRDDVEVLVECRADSTQPERGNCFVDYWLNLRDYGFRAHIAGIWLSATKDNLLDKIKLHMMRDLERHIKLYEQYIEVLEKHLEQIEDDNSF